MYLDEKEKWYKRMMDERVERDGVLSLEYFIDGGNRCSIYNTNGQAILIGLTIEQAYWVVMGIENFWSKIERR